MDPNRLAFRPKSLAVRTGMRSERLHSVTEIEFND